MAQVLIIDDDRTICDAIATVVRQIGHDAHCASSFDEGIKASLRQELSLVIVDVQLPDGNGLDLLPRLREKLPSPEVIIMTGHGDPDGAELAIRNGTWDYIQKPAVLENIALALTRALQYQEEKLKRPVPVPLMRDMIIGTSLPIKECLDLVALAASSDANTLISGETGTGKELFAAAIHNNSPRAKNNFVVVDCSALPGTLVESVLFGHEKGAYTGADLSHGPDGTYGRKYSGSHRPLRAVSRPVIRAAQEVRYRQGHPPPIASQPRNVSVLCGRNDGPMARKLRSHSGGVIGRDMRSSSLRTNEMGLSYLAYVAECKAQSAETSASIATVQSKQDQANNEYRIMPGNALANSKQDLSQTRDGLSASEQSGDMTKERLAAE